MPVYSDMTPGLTITPIGNVEVVYDVDVVIQSIKTILSTVNGERVRNPIGAKVIRYLFQPMNADTALAIKNEILISIQSYEPRVVIHSVMVQANYDGNYYAVKCEFSVKGFSTRQTYGFKLKNLSGSF